ncbi:TetR/AcrR family transcriptional regulator [Leucobacter iarius]|uniref:HTH tetR-type domain-containing protein n=1 Tax=Leucobacter iarius TaxID=333963 RepID=A0ABN2LHB1_9MICO
MTSQESSVSFRRLSREERRTELLRAAVALAFEDGLARVTARRIAARVEVAQGLITHYFKSVDGVLVAVFEAVAEGEREAVEALSCDDPVEELRRQISFYLSPDRDPTALLWLDAWRESPHRPLLREAVIRQMELDVRSLSALLERGKAWGAFPGSSERSALRILALLDGLSANAAVRAGLSGAVVDYSDAADFVIATIERELGLASGALARD